MGKLLSIVTGESDSKASSINTPSDVVVLGAGVRREGGQRDQLSEISRWEEKTTTFNALFKKCIDLCGVLQLGRAQLPSYRVGYLFQVRNTAWNVVVGGKYPGYISE